MKNSFISNYLGTFFTQVYVTLCSVLLLKIISYNTIKENFSAFLIGKRFIALIIPLITINLSLSLARYVSLKEKNSITYIGNALIIVLVLNMLSFGIVALFNNSLSKLIFGEVLYSSILNPIQFFVFVSSIHLLITGFFRGNKDFYRMNIFECIFWTFQLIGGVLFIGQNKGELTPLVNYYYYVSVIVLVFEISMLLYIYRPRIDLKIYKKFSLDNLSKDKQFIYFGFSRLWQSFFFMGFFFFPLLIATNNISLVSAGYIGIILSVLNLVQIFIYPFNLMLLPTFSNLQSTSDTELIQKYSKIIINFILSFALLFGPLIYLFSKEIIILWFGTDYSQAIIYLKMLSPFVVFLIMFLMIKGILDGLYEYPYANYITFFSLLGIFVVTYSFFFIGFDIQSIIFGIAFGLSILGFGSLFILIKKLHISVIEKNHILGLIWGLIFFIIIIFCTYFLDSMSIFLSIISKLVLSCFFIIITFYIYWKKKFIWITEFSLRIKLLYLRKD